MCDHVTLAGNLACAATHKEHQQKVACCSKGTGQGTFALETWPCWFQVQDFCSLLVKRSKKQQQNRVGIVGCWVVVSVALRQACYLLGFDERGAD